MYHFQSFLFNFEKAEMQIIEHKNKKKFLKISFFDKIIAFFYKMSEIGKIFKNEKNWSSSKA